MDTPEPCVNDAHHFLPLRTAQGIAWVCMHCGFRRTSDARD